MQFETRRWFFIRPFRVEDTEQVVELWKRCHLSVPRNDPYKEIQKELKVQAALFVEQITPESRALPPGVPEASKGNAPKTITVAGLLRPR